MPPVVTKSRQKNDCVLTAISTAENLPYEDVQKALNWYSTLNGTPVSLYTPYLISLGYHKRETIPRQGQNKITGLVRLHSGSKRLGVHHLVYMENGIVYDNSFPNGLPLKQYQILKRCKHVTEIFLRLPTVVAPIIKTRTEFAPNWMDELFPVPSVEPV